MQQYLVYQISPIFHFCWPLGTVLGSWLGRFVVWFMEKRPARCPIRLGRPALGFGWKKEKQRNHFWTVNERERGGERERFVVTLFCFIIYFGVTKNEAVFQWKKRKPPKHHPTPPLQPSPHPSLFLAYIVLCFALSVIVVSFLGHCVLSICFFLVSPPIYLFTCEKIHYIFMNTDFMNIEY